MNTPIYTLETNASAEKIRTFFSNGLVDIYIYIYTYFDCLFLFRYIWILSRSKTQTIQWLPDWLKAAPRYQKYKKTDEIQ